MDDLCEYDLNGSRALDHMTTNIKIILPNQGKETDER